MPKTFNPIEDFATDEQILKMCKMYGDFSEQALIRRFDGVNASVAKERLVLMISRGVVFRLPNGLYRPSQSN